MKKINELYCELISDYGNTAYLKRTNDIQFLLTSKMIEDTWNSEGENSFSDFSRRIKYIKKLIKNLELDLGLAINNLECEFKKSEFKGEKYE